MRVSAQSADDRPADPGPLPVLADRFGYLLKHAQLRLAELARAALAPFGISGRELAVLLAINDGAAASQQEVARRMAVGRTTLRRATTAAGEAERRFLSSLSGDESAMLKKALQTIAFPG